MINDLFPQEERWKAGRENGFHRKEEEEEEEEKADRALATKEHSISDPPIKFS